MLDDLGRFFFQFDQDLVLLLDFLFLVDDLEAHAVLEADEVLRIASEWLVAGPWLADRQVLPKRACEYRRLQLTVQLLSQGDDFGEVDCRCSRQEHCQVLNAVDLQELLLACQ